MGKMRKNECKKRSGVDFSSEECSVPFRSVPFRLTSAVYSPGKSIRMLATLKLWYHMSFRCIEPRRMRARNSSSAMRWGRRGVAWLAAILGKEVRV
jgi:hypothetical protein